MLLLALLCGSLRYGGPKARASSPVPGRSILITSAPRSPSICADKGPASTRVRSTTLMPESGSADGLADVLSDMGVPPEYRVVARIPPAVWGEPIYHFCRTRTAL